MRVLIQSSIFCAGSNQHEGMQIYIMRMLKHCNLKPKPRSFKIKFMYSEKATKFYEIFTLLLSYVVPVKSKVKISQNFVAFSEYMNFMYSKFEFGETIWWTAFRRLWKGNFRIDCLIRTLFCRLAWLGLWSIIIGYTK